ncbi:MAG: hypothetical protein HQM01_00545 [Magnetococcales bacterium]|nr:hypothetical protein [Magnetococcales bacterium]
MMTDREYYATLVNSIFGNGSATFDVTDTLSNNVIGALKKPGEFVEFTANFVQRLRRLAAAIQVDISLRRGILATINKIVTAEWDGAYAELCAIDYFLADPSTGPGKVVLDCTVPGIQTLASDMGMQHVNYDMKFPDLGVSMDTKLLSDKIGRILEGVCKDFQKDKNIQSLTILPSYNQDEDFATYQINRQKLLDELCQSVDINARPSNFDSRIIAGLSYEFSWEPGVLMAESTYSPFEHAMNHHHLLFGHSKKFSKVEPSVIVFVVFPWAGENVVAVFKDSTMIFFKEFCKNFFSRYLFSSNQAVRFNDKIKSTITAGDVTKHLAGILFLEDNSILANTPDNVNVKASFFWNPNALHPLTGSRLEACLQARGAVDLQTIC